MNEWTTRLIGNTNIEEAVAEVAPNFFWDSTQFTQEHFAEHHRGESTTVLGYEDGRLVALLTIRWQSNYPPFRERSVPLIQHIEVRAEDRGRGYGTKIMDEAETLIAQRASSAGICVNISREFGLPMQLYMKRGFLPDGRGATRRLASIVAGQSIDDVDEVFLWLFKPLRRS